MIIKDVTGKKQIHIAKFLGYYDQMQNALRGKCTSSRDQILASPLTLSTSKRVGKILTISEPQFPHLQNGNDYISSSVMSWWLNKISWKCLEFFPGS